MKTETTVAVSENNLKVKVVVINEGDEAAFNVQININENQRIQSSPIKQVLAVKEHLEYETNYNLSQTKHGRYPLIVNLDYTDANQYPFTAITGTHYAYGSDSVSRVFGSAGDVRLTGQATLPLKLKNLDETAKEVQISLIIPKETSSQEKVKNITLAPRSELNVAFTISNFSALPGSRYQAFFVLEYEDDSRHYSSIVPCVVSVEESTNIFKQFKWYIIAGAAVLFIILMVFQFMPSKHKNS